MWFLLMLSDEHVDNKGVRGEEAVVGQMVDTFSVVAVTVKKYD